MNFTGIIRNLNTGESQTFDNIEGYNALITKFVDEDTAFTASTSSLYVPETVGDCDCECCKDLPELTKEDVEFIKDFAQSYKEFTKKFEEFLS